MQWLPSCRADCNFVNQDWMDCSEMTIKELRIAINILADENIEKLTIHHCNISTLPKDLFHSDSFSRTSQLDINELGINSIQPGTFQRFTGLKQLSISNNHIETFDGRIFGNNTSTIDQ